MLSFSDSRSLAKAKMGEGLEGRTKVLSDDKFKALNKALKIDKKKPQGEYLFSLRDSADKALLGCSGTTSAITAMGQLVFVAKTSYRKYRATLPVLVLHVIG